jgi:hypothetical protein
MPSDTVRILAEPSGLVPGTAPPLPLDKLLVGLPQLARLTSLSLRHLRRLDSSRDIPGRVTCGRRVLFQTDIIQAWVRAGLPCRDKWAALQAHPVRR